MHNCLSLCSQASDSGRQVSPLPGSNSPLPFSIIGLRMEHQAQEAQQVNTPVNVIRFATTGISQDLVSDICKGCNLMASAGLTINMLTSACRARLGNVTGWWGLLVRSVQDIRAALNATASITEIVVNPDAPEAEQQTRLIAGAEENADMRQLNTVLQSLARSPLGNFAMQAVLAKAYHNLEVDYDGLTATSLRQLAPHLQVVATTNYEYCLRQAMGGRVSFGLATGAAAFGDSISSLPSVGRTRPWTDAIVHVHGFLDGHGLDAPVFTNGHYVKAGYAVGPVHILVRDDERDGWQAMQDKFEAKVPGFREWAEGREGERANVYFHVYGSEHSELGIFLHYLANAVAA
ncbi:hypothetical protein WJX73_001920 [Symbiochloris irregularis]|uniref:Uncharacterized protein n=1 Tax=Symbiochloris irregularis TaxID=706552 RepID=A0AAW1NP08_9CHLO